MRAAAARLGREGGMTKFTCTPYRLTAFGMAAPETKVPCFAHLRPRSSNHQTNHHRSVPSKQSRRRAGACDELPAVFIWIPVHPASPVRSPVRSRGIPPAGASEHGTVRSILYHGAASNAVYMQDDSRSEPRTMGLRVAHLPARAI
jgi:hypothetical protein